MAERKLRDDYDKGGGMKPFRLTLGKNRTKNLLEQCEKMRQVGYREILLRDFLVLLIDWGLKEAGTREAIKRKLYGEPEENGEQFRAAPRQLRFPLKGNWSILGG